MNSPPRWLRGNLHAHTTLSDGSQTPDELIADYAALGYDFLALTEHDCLVSVQSYQPDSGLLLVPGVEVTAAGPHLCALGVTREIAPTPDRQEAIDAACAQNALTVLNHPHWQSEYRHWDPNELDRLQGYLGIEIFNGIAQFLEGDALATDCWDRVLSSGRRVWGFANDDTHFGGGVGCGWNMVRLPLEGPVTWPALRAAILAGDCYASTGVTLRDVVWDDGTLHVTSENADRVRFFGTYGRMLASQDGADASFKPPAEELYVRAEAYGPRGSVAWTQPVFPHLPRP